MSAVAEAGHQSSGLSSYALPIISQLDLVRNSVYLSALVLQLQIIYLPLHIGDWVL